MKINSSIYINLKHNWQFYLLPQIKQVFLFWFKKYLKMKIL